MNRELLFLVVAYGIVWLAMFGYLLYLTGRVRNVGEEVRQLRRELDRPEEGPPQPDG